MKRVWTSEKTAEFQAAKPLRLSCTALHLARRASIDPKTMRVPLLLCACAALASAFAPPTFSERAAARAAPARTADRPRRQKKKKDLQTPKPVRERKVKDDKIEVDGVVTEALPSANFPAEIGATKQVLLCTISGKIRKNFVKILVGDSVKVELSPYDCTRAHHVSERN